MFYLIQVSICSNSKKAAILLVKYLSSLQSIYITQHFTMHYVHIRIGIGRTFFDMSLQKPCKTMHLWRLINCNIHQCILKISRVMQR